MFSKILIKLIDQSIVPAILLIAVKIVSIVLLSKARGIEVILDPTGFAFPNVGDYILVNSYSTLLMLMALGVGFIYILVKAFVFHDSHITPRMTANVFSTRLHGIVQSSYDLYTQGSIWLSYLFFITLAAALMTYFGLLYAWVFYVALALLVVTTVLFIMDIENELHTPTKSWEGIEDAEE